ncbi:MAG: hypothetical protein ACR2JU_11880 [Nocardioidaceae bacterium]
MFRQSRNRCALGFARDDTPPGLRATNYRKRAIVAYAILDERRAVIGILHGGHDYEAILPDDDEQFAADLA